MSRAINLALPMAEVRNLCVQRGISVSAIEPLPQGGTHVVCTSGEGADEIRLTLGDHVITRRVSRFPFYRG